MKLSRERFAPEFIKNYVYPLFIQGIKPKKVL